MRGDLLHSLEDRIVKDFFREQSKELVNPLYERIYEVERKAVVKLINKKPILPSLRKKLKKPDRRAAQNLELLKRFNGLLVVE